MVWMTSGYPHVLPANGPRAMHRNSTSRRVASGVRRIAGSGRADSRLGRASTALLLSNDTPGSPGGAPASYRLRWGVLPRGECTSRGARLRRLTCSCRRPVNAVSAFPCTQMHAGTRTENSPRRTASPRVQRWLVQSRQRSCVWQVGLWVRRDDWHAVSVARPVPDRPIEDNVTGRGPERGELPVLLWPLGGGYISVIPRDAHRGRRWNSLAWLTSFEGERGEGAIADTSDRGCRSCRRFLEPPPRRLLWLGSAPA
jgi:hypothetical protein